MSARLTIHDTGRRFPRTAVQAFPRTVEAAAWIFHIRPRKPLGDRIAQWAGLAAMLCVGLLALTGNLPGGVR